MKKGKDRIAFWVLIALIAMAVLLLTGALVRYADYRARPAAYEAQSAPWYTGALVQALVTGAAAVPLAVLLVWLKKKGR